MNGHRKVPKTNLNERIFATSGNQTVKLMKARLDMYQESLLGGPQTVKDFNMWNLLYMYSQTSLK